MNPEAPAPSPYLVLCTLSMSCSWVAPFYKWVISAALSRVLWTLLANYRIQRGGCGNTWFIARRFRSTGDLDFSLSSEVGANLWVCVSLCVCVSCLVVTDFLQSHGLYPARLLCPWNFPGNNTGVDCHFLLQVSSQPRDQTWVSCTVGRCFTIWATREALWVYTNSK